MQSQSPSPIQVKRATSQLFNIRYECKLRIRDLRKTSNTKKGQNKIIQKKIKEKRKEVTGRLTRQSRYTICCKDSVPTAKNDISDEVNWHSRESLLAFRFKMAE